MVCCPWRFLANFGRLYRASKANIGDIALMVANFGYNSVGWETDEATAENYYRRARALAERSTEPLHRYLIPAITSLRVENGAPSADAPTMLAWLPRFSDKASRAYLLSFVAETLAPHDPDTAICLADTYCTLVDGDPSEYPCRLRDKGNLLRHCGRPAESVAFLSEFEAQDEFRDALKHVDIAKGLVALNAKTEATSYLTEAKKRMQSLAAFTLPFEIASTERLMV